MYDPLTPREREVLNLIVAGKRTKELAYDLGITFKTACCHRQRVMEKLGAHNAAELIRNATQNGVIVSIARKSAPCDGKKHLDGLLRDRLTSTLEEQRKDREALAAEIAQARTLRAELRQTRRQLRVALDDILTRTSKLIVAANRRSNPASEPRDLEG